MITKEDYRTLINDSIRRNETVVISCTCSVWYSGRAESFLDKGDRLIIIKSDKVCLVHQPEGNNPVNYMKAGTEIYLEIQEGNLWLKCKNSDNKDFMDVEINKIQFFNAHKLEDGSSIEIRGTEEDMSDMLYNNPQMVEEGFTPVSREEQTKYGFLDVFGTDRNGNLVIVECKRTRAELSAVTQLRRYAEKIRESKGFTGKIRGIIASPQITANAEQMLKDWGFEYKRINPPKYHERFDKKQHKLDGFIE